jgi:hypothetical protein
VAIKRIKQENNGQINRPASVTILALGVLSLALFNLLGLVQILSNWDFLKNLLPFTPAVLGLFRLSWGVAGLVISWGLWTGRNWAPNATRLTGLIYAANIWLYRLFLYAPAVKGSNNLFVAFVILSILILIFWALARKQAKQFFGVQHEHKID